MTSCEWEVHAMILDLNNEERTVGESLERKLDETISSMRLEMGLKRTPLMLIYLVLLLVKEYGFDMIKYLENFMHHAWGKTF